MKNYIAIGIVISAFVRHHSYFLAENYKSLQQLDYRENWIMLTESTIFPRKNILSVIYEYTSIPLLINAKLNVRFTEILP